MSNQTEEKNGITTGAAGFETEGGVLVKYTGENPDVSIPEGVTEIGEKAFYYSKTLKTVILPSTVKKIGKCAFQGCFELEYAELPEDLEYIGEYAFGSCRKIEGIELYGGIAVIADHAFYDCRGLKSVVIPSTVETIGQKAFAECRGLKKATILAGVENIADEAFYGCSVLESVSIPSTVESIGRDAFGGCENLASFTVDGDNEVYSAMGGDLYDKDGTTLVRYAIGKGERSFSIPSTVRKIGEGAFEYSQNLTRVELPEGLTEIGKSAFDRCKNLQSVTIPASVTAIGEGAFYGCDELSPIEVSSQNEAYRSIDGDLYTKDGSVLVQYAPGKQSPQFSFPFLTTKVAPYAFAGNRKLKKVTATNSNIEEIGRRAFYLCSGLESVEMPETLTYIGEEAFLSCDHANFTFYAGLKRVEKKAFYQCEYGTFYLYMNKPAGKFPAGWDEECFGTNYMDPTFVWKAPAKPDQNRSKLVGECEVKGSTLKKYHGFGGDVVIPEGVKFIGEKAFYGNEDITSVTFPSGVDMIETRAFYGCTRLENVEIPEGVTTIGSFAFASCRALKNVTIPASVKFVSAAAFADCPEATIFCKVKKPLFGLPKFFEKDWLGTDKNAMPKVVWRAK